MISVLGVAMPFSGRLEVVRVSGVVNTSKNI
jgi:hypothetical protein